MEVQSFLKLHGRRLLLEIILSHHAVLGVFLDFDAIAGQEEHRDGIENHQPNRPQGDAGVHGQAHQCLGHAGGVGVDHTAGKAYSGGEHDDGGAHHLVIAQGDEQRDDNGIEGIEGIQVTDDAHAGEDREEQKYHYQIPALGPLDEGLNTGGEGPGLLDDLDGTADEQHGSDHIGALHKALVKRGKKAQEGNRGLLHIGKAVRIHISVHPGVCSGGDHISHDGYQQHQDQNDGVHMGHAEAFFLF